MHIAQLRLHVQFHVKIKFENIKKFNFTGKLTIIIGKSGSGKTSLLAAILKEMRIMSGELIWNK